MKLLWLPGWYPSKIDRFTGDFIQRHARAVALFETVHVIFVVKDEKGNMPVSIEHTIKGRLHETVAYFKPVKTGIKPVDRLLSILKYRQVSRQLVNEFIKEEGLPSLVHVHVALWAGITALWLKRKFNIPYVITEHWTGYDRSMQENWYTKDFFFRTSTKKILRQAELLLPVSNHLGRLITQNVAAVPYRVIPNVVDTDHFTFYGEKLPVFRFIHVSAMNYQKNCEGIVRSFSALLLQNNAVELIMVGPAGSELKLLADQLGISRQVRWTGEMAYENVAEMLKEASCFVMFSRYENLPCAILEALCCGLPVIATSTGGIPEIINTSNGVLVASEKENELLEAMIAMAGKNDVYDKLRISKEARNNFNYHKIGRQIINVYQELRVRTPANS